jgi:hypothetical protein
MYTLIMKQLQLFYKDLRVKCMNIDTFIERVGIELLKRVDLSSGINQLSLDFAQLSATFHSYIDRGSEADSLHTRMCFKFHCHFTNAACSSSQCHVLE